jgi:hypothetical protein
MIQLNIKESVNNIEDNVWTNVTINVRDNVMENVWTNVNLNVRDNVRDNVWKNVGLNFLNNVYYHLINHTKQI